MSIQFIIGRSGSGKTIRAMNEIAETMRQFPNRNFIFLVPDQMTFQMENYFLEWTGLEGAVNVQVYGFNYLAFRVLQEIGGLANTFLSRSGMEVLIRQVVHENKEKLTIFKKSAQQKGFYSEIIQLFTELKRYDISPQELDAYSVSMGDQTTAAKMSDMSMLYAQYQEDYLDKYLESEDYLRLLKERGKKSAYLRRSFVYIDGFDHFSTQELSVIEMLFKTSARVSVNITKRSLPLSSKMNEFDLFQLNEDTYFSLKEIAVRNHLPLEKTVFLEKNCRTKDKPLKHLEDTWGEMRVKKYEGKVNSIHIHQASNPRIEIEGIARQIKKLVEVEGYKYKDIALLLRDIDTYKNVIETVMATYKIPYFLDQKRTMSHHPFIEFIRSIVEAIIQNWQYQPLFQAVRTEFFFSDYKNTKSLRNKMDIFENYLLEQGIYNKKKWGQSDWQYRKIRGLSINVGVQTDEEKEIEEIVQEMRSLIQEPLLYFEKSLSTAKTGLDYATSLYEFLQSVKADEHLEYWRFQAEKEGLLELSREHEEAWEAVMLLLEEFVELAGEVEVTKDDFFDMLITGLDALEFSLLPPALDQLVITSIEKARLLQIKVVFAAGLNDGVFPARLEEKGILSNKDRKNLLEQGICLKPSLQKLLVHEEFLAYRLFSFPSDHLFLSFSAADLEGKLQPESVYVRKIKAQFPRLQEEVYLVDPRLLNDKEQSNYIASVDSSLGLLTNQLQMYKRGYSISPVWWDLYNYLLATKDSKAKQVLSSLNYQNDTTKLTKETASALFGKDIHASVSQMEKFFGCEFQHYAQYGLKLEERAVFQLQPVDMESIFHESMRWIANNLQRNNHNWGELTETECRYLAKQAVSYLAPRLHHQILLSSSRMGYIKYKLLNIIFRATSTLNEQAKTSAFRPLDLGVYFGLDKKIPPLTISLENKHNLILQGKIDRIDKAEENGRTFLRIVDYKSSSRDLPINEVYYGLTLQMLTYLDVTITNAAKLIGKTADPAGVLYFHMHNQFVHANEFISDEELTDSLQKNYRMKGLLLEDPLAVTLMDNQLKEGGRSLVIPAEMKKDGSLSNRSKTVSKKDFDLMRQFARFKHKQAAENMLDGKITINPYKLKETTPCQFCSFRSLCQFDPAIVNNQYRYLESIQVDEIMKRMREEGANEQ